MGQSVCYRYRKWRKYDKKTFEFSFDDLSENNAISYEVDTDSRLSLDVCNDNLIIYLNKNGALTLSKLLAQIALGEYESGFHIHLQEDFNTDKSELLTIILD